MPCGIKHNSKHHSYTSLDVGVENLEFLHDFVDPLLDRGHVNVDAHCQVELVVDGVDVAELLEEHRPFHVAGSLNVVNFKICEL